LRPRERREMHRSEKAKECEPVSHLAVRFNEPESQKKKAPALKSRGKIKNISPVGGEGVKLWWKRKGAAGTKLRNRG